MELVDMNELMPRTETQMGFFTASGFELMQRVAKAFASSSLVPKDYQGNIANTMVALNMAQRMGADPLMCMQHLHIIHGRPGWSAQFLIATFNQCGRFSSIRYRWRGTDGKPDWACQAYATEKATGDEIASPWISLAMAKSEGWSTKAGSKWLTMPELMMSYRSAAFLIRTHAPELSMGLQTVDEIRDMGPAQVVENTVVDLNRTLAAIAAPKVEPEAQPVLELTPPDAVAEILAGIARHDPADLDVWLDEAREQGLSEADMTRVEAAIEARRGAA
jgi:hypothetical protein